MQGHYFLEMIRNLRENEEVILYGNILQTNEEEEADVINFLKDEYDSEALSYPYVVPAFDAEAALWAAKTVYISAQLILYRENKAADLGHLLPGFPNEKNASAILSADLCLRFLPIMIVQLELIDTEDALIGVLLDQLTEWHYSGINYPLSIENLDFEHIKADKCLHQLYVNRIIDTKKTGLANHPDCKMMVNGSLGDFADEYWKEYKLVTSSDE